jgi:hypothetical protein
VLGENQVNAPLLPLTSVFAILLRWRLYRIQHGEHKGLRKAEAIYFQRKLLIKKKRHIIYMRENFHMNTIVNSNKIDGGRSKWLITRIPNGPKSKMRFSLQ